MFKKVVPNFRNRSRPESDETYHPALGRSLKQKTHLARLENIQRRLSDNETVFQQTVELLLQSMNQKRYDFADGFCIKLETNTAQTEKTGAMDAQAVKDCAIPQPDQREAAMTVTTPSAPASVEAVKQAEPAAPILSAERPAPEPVLGALSIPGERPAPAQMSGKSLLRRLVPRGLFDLKPLFSSQPPTVNRIRKKEIN